MSGHGGASGSAASTAAAATTCRGDRTSVLSRPAGRASKSPEQLASLRGSDDHGSVSAAPQLRDCRSTAGLSLITSGLSLAGKQHEQPSPLWSSFPQTVHILT